MQRYVWFEISEERRSVWFVDRSEKEIFEDILRSRFPVPTDHG